MIEVRTVHGGLGVFATAALPTGVTVLVFRGPTVDRQAIPPSEVRHAAGLNGRWIVPEAPARYVNHGCAPNVDLHDDGQLVTLRAVQAGEELCFDYAALDAPDDEAVWDPQWSFDCLCGAPTCRGRVDGYVVRSGAGTPG